MFNVAFSGLGLTDCQYYGDDKNIADLPWEQ